MTSILPRIARLVLLPGALLLVVLGAMIGAGAAPASAATHSIVIAQYAYSPRSLTITQGDTVTWTNKDSVAHDVTVTSGPEHLHSPMLAQGQSWSHTFTAAGSYSYLCSVHPDMTAALVVQARPSPKPQPTVTRPPASPAVAAPQSHSTTAHTMTPPAARATAPHASSTQAAAEAPAATTADFTATTTEASLDPLLLVAGASTAVMVFCLLLLSSRPVSRPAEVETTTILPAIEDDEQD